VEDNPENTEAVEAPSQIVITFTAGPHSTNMQCAYIRVDAAQIELAGHFLVRTAEQMQAANIAQHQTPKIVPATRMPNA
jgi:hypothetical protein